MKTKLYGYTYNKEIGGKHQQAAVYVDLPLHKREPPVDDTFIPQWDCPHCGAIKSVYKTELLSHTRCLVCFKRSNQEYILKHQ